jgi:hypothetical protein
MLHSKPLGSSPNCVTRKLRCGFVCDTYAKYSCYTTRRRKSRQNLPYTHQLHFQTQFTDTRNGFRTAGSISDGTRAPTGKYSDTTCTANRCLYHRGKKKEKKKEKAAFASAHNCGSNALQHNLGAKQNFANRWYLHWGSAGETDLTLVLFRN